jgi:hypothetical protein
MPTLMHGSLCCEVHCEPPAGIISDGTFIKWPRSAARIHASRTDDVWRGLLGGDAQHEGYFHLQWCRVIKGRCKGPRKTVSMMI